MPKATKKKKEKVADFKKAKLKLGKGKKAASNATDTSFKARSIALPSQKQLSRALATQAEAEDGSAGPSSIPTTASGLTLDDVLVQLRHVNAGVRRESLTHMKEVLSAGVNLGIPLGERHGEVAKVMRGVGGLLADDEAHVRKALLEFLAWYLARLPRAALSPYLSLLLLQLSSALSHIFPAVRIDACRVVELVLETHAPDVVGSWPSSASQATATTVPTSGSTVFDGLRLSAGLGGEKGASTQAGFRLTPASKLVILRTITKFVASALDTKEEEMESSTMTAPALGTFDLAELALSAGVQWSLGTYDWALEWNGAGKQRQARDLTSDGALEELSSTYLSLHPLLLATFMEAAPLAFSPSSSVSDEVSMSLCSVTTEMAWLFASSLINAPGFDELSSAGELRAAFAEFLRRMTAWFPFSRPSEPDASGTLFTLSLHYAKLAALLAPKPPRIAPPRRQSGWRQRVRAVEAAWASKRDSDSKSKSKAIDGAYRLAAEWVEECLAPPADALAPALPAQAYAALLPVLWLLLQEPGAPIAEPLLSAVLRQPSAGGKRRASDGFIVRLIDAHEDRFSTLPFFIPLNSPARPLVHAWIGAAPRTLWELGGKDAEASAALLRFLLRVGTRGPGAYEQPYSLISAELFPGVAAKLIPFFHLLHPSKGGIDGPWARLPTDTQRLALDVARTWAPLDESGKLGGAVSRAVAGTEWAAAYWGRK